MLSVVSKYKLVEIVLIAIFDLSASCVVFKYRTVEIETIRTYHSFLKSFYSIL